MIKKLIMIVVAFSFMGCGPSVKIRKVNNNVIDKIIVYTNRELLNQENVKAIRVLEATSCQYLLWDSRASETNCINQLKMAAYNIGANGIILIGQFKKGGMSLDKDCWSTVECSAIAIIIKKDDKK